MIKCVIRTIKYVDTVVIIFKILEQLNNFNENFILPYIIGIFSYILQNL